MVIDLLGLLLSRKKGMLTQSFHFMIDSRVNL